MATKVDELLEIVKAMAKEIKELKEKPVKVKAVRGPRKAKAEKSQEPIEFPPLMALDTTSDKCIGRVYGAKNEYDAVHAGYSPALFMEARCSNNPDIDGLCVKCFTKRKAYNEIKDDSKINTGNYVQKSIKWFGVIGQVPIPEAHFPHSEWAKSKCKKVEVVEVPEPVVPEPEPVVPVVVEDTKKKGKAKK